MYFTELFRFIISWSFADSIILLSYTYQSQSINKVPTRFDVYIKGNRNDIFATRGADIAILTGFGENLSTKVHGFIRKKKKN
jgi:hypothetical protein